MKQRVLFVDDDPNVLSGLRRIVKEYCGEWETSYARNGNEALDHLFQIGTDVVVTDVQMPGMTGLDLLRKIQSTEEIKGLWEYLCIRLGRIQEKTPWCKDEVVESRYHSLGRPVG